LANRFLALISGKRKIAPFYAFVKSTEAGFWPRSALLRFPIDAGDA
jgi:hypothetical protein